MPATSNGIDETQPLLGSSQNAAKPTWWQRRMSVQARRSKADLILLSCYIITGLLDSASISTWGSFVSMQTGNTIYVGVGLGAPSASNRWKKSGISIIAFCAGSFFFSRLHRAFTKSPKVRWVLCLSFTLQLLFIVAAALILELGPKMTPGSDAVPWNVLVPIALMAFQSCGQAVASRALKYNALTSVVLTSIYCDLFSDAELFAGLTQNVERNQRTAAPLLTLVGALIGGIIARSPLGTAGALWLAAALKLVILGSWYLWPEEEE